MKKISILLFASIIASVFAFTSCAKDDNNSGGDNATDRINYKGSYSITLDSIRSTKMYGDVSFHFQQNISSYMAYVYGLNSDEHKFVFAISGVPTVGKQEDVNYLISTAPSVAVMYSDPNGEEPNFYSRSGYVKRDSEDKITVSVTGRLDGSSEDIILTGTIIIGVRE